jgi:hypothetical protein
MAIREVFKVSRKTFFNPSAWIDVGFLKYQNGIMKSTLTGLFSTDKPEHEETFAAAVKRLHLSEKSIKNTTRTFRLYALIFALCGFIIFFYSFYLLFRYTSITGWLLGLAASGLFFSQAFKFDFWAFQMRKRKLGATFEEWKQDILGGKDASS